MLFCKVDLKQGIRFRSDSPLEIQCEGSHTNSRVLLNGFHSSFMIFFYTCVRVCLHSLQVVKPFIDLCRLSLLHWMNLSSWGW